MPAKYDPDALRVVCETCGAGRNQKCRTTDRTNAGMRKMWDLQRETKPHRGRLERGRRFATKRARREPRPASAVRGARRL